MKIFRILEPGNERIWFVGGRKAAVHCIATANWSGNLKKIIQMEKCKNKLKIVKNHVWIWNVKMFKCQQPIGAETWIIQIKKCK